MLLSCFKTYISSPFEFLNFHVFWVGSKILSASFWYLISNFLCSRMSCLERHNHLLYVKKKQRFTVQLLFPSGLMKQICFFIHFLGNIALLFMGRLELFGNIDFSVVVFIIYLVPIYIFCHFLTFHELFSPFMKEKDAYPAFNVLVMKEPVQYIMQSITIQLCLLLPDT